MTITNKELEEWKRESQANNLTDEIMKYLVWKYPDNKPFLPCEDISDVYDQIYLLTLNYMKPKSYWQKVKDWWTNV